MTKIAFQSESPATLRAWLEAQADGAHGEARLTTRYVPKRAVEMAGGSLYWIHGGILAGRSPLLGFAQKDDGRWWIRLEPRLIAVTAQARRAHQGWRYLAEGDAPADLADGMAEGDAMPGRLVQELSRLGLA